MRCEPQPTQEQIERGFGKNAGEWTGRVQNKQGRNPWQYAQHVWLYTDLLQALKGERLSSVSSPDGTLISASAAAHCGDQGTEDRQVEKLIFRVWTERQTGRKTDYQGIDRKTDGQKN